MREAILRAKQDCIESAQYDLSDEAIAKCSRALESNAGADLLAKAQSAARLAEALRGVINSAVEPETAQFASMVKLEPLRAALREFEQTQISPNQQNT